MMCAGKNGKNWTAPASKTLITKWAFGENFDIHRAYNVSFPSDYIWYLNTTDYEIFTKNHQLEERETTNSINVRPKCQRNGFIDSRKAVVKSL